MTKKKRVSLVIAAIFVAASAIACPFVVRYVQERCRQDRIYQAWNMTMNWRFLAEKVPASQAAQHWRRLREEAGEYYDSLAEEDRLVGPAVLSGKFCAEGKYEEAFNYGQEADRIATDYGPAPFYVMLAGLAGRTEWLEGKLARPGPDEDALFQLYVRANLLWTRGQYDALIEITDPAAWADLLAETDPSLNVEQCLRFLRAKALLQQDMKEQAWEELVEAGYSDYWARESPVYLMHYLMCLIRTASDMDRLDQVSASIQAVRKYMRDYPDVSYNAYGQELDQIQAEHKRRAATSAPSQPK